SLGVTVRTERYRYAEYNGGKAGAMLFDETADPEERKNLADDPRYARVRAELARLARQHAAGLKGARIPRPPVDRHPAGEYRQQVPSPAERRPRRQRSVGATPPPPPRRDVLQTTAKVAAVSALAGVSIPTVHAASGETVQIALVGAGGRGTGAAENALATG